MIETKVKIKVFFRESILNLLGTMKNDILFLLLQLFIKPLPHLFFITFITFFPKIDPFISVAFIHSSLFDCILFFRHNKYEFYL